MAQAAQRNRLRAADWEEAALDMIGEAGVAAVAVEPLARRLKVTKGSFYWHFANRDALLTAALSRWEHEDATTFDRSVARFDQAREKLGHMFRLTIKQTRSHRLFASLFSAADHPLVHPFLRRVTQSRIGYLTRGLRELGLDQASAAHRARLTFFSYIGFLQYYRQFRADRLSGQSLEGYLEHATETLVPQPLVPAPGCPDS